MPSLKTDTGFDAQRARKWHCRRLAHPSLFSCSLCVCAHALVCHSCVILPFSLGSSVDSFVPTRSISLLTLIGVHGFKRTIGFASG